MCYAHSLNALRVVENRFTVSFGQNICKQSRNTHIFMHFLQLICKHLASKCCYEQEANFAAVDMVMAASTQMLFKQPIAQPPRPQASNSGVCALREFGVDGECEREKFEWRLKTREQIKTHVGERPLDRNLPVCAQLSALVFLRIAAAARQNAVFDVNAAPMRRVDHKQNVALIEDCKAKCRTTRTIHVNGINVLLRVKHVYALINSLRLINFQDEKLSIYDLNNFN